MYRFCYSILPQSLRIYVQEVIQLNNKCTSLMIAQRKLSTGPSKKSDDSINSLYNEEEKGKILDLFNKCSHEELLLTKQISFHKALSVIKHRTDNGNFQKISDVLTVPGFGLIGLQKICNVLKSVEHDSLKDLKQIVIHQKVKTQPSLSVETAKRIESIVALDIHTDCVTWTKMSRSLEVEDWSHVQVLDRTVQKYCPVNFLEKMLSTVSKIPDADIYVMESKVFRFPNLRIVPFLTNLRVLEAMLFTILNKDLDETGEHKVYLTPSTAVTRFYSLSVGGERVSGQHILRDIIRGTSDMAADVHIPEYFWDSYSKQNSVQQEKYSNCLLLAVAFYKLIVLQTHTLPS